MIRSLVDKIARASAWRGKYKRISPREVPVKVNLGSGLRVAPGWINLDGSLNAFLSSWPEPILKRLYHHSDCRQWYTRDQYVRVLTSNRFVYHRLEHGLPFEDESVDYVYSSHLLEHLYKEDALLLLKEVHRALKKGGGVRLAVPDLAVAVRLYQEGQKQKALGYFFTESRPGAFNCHRYMYDYDLLRELLVAAAFVEVERCDFRVGKTPDIEYLDHLPEETLFVEARK